MLRGIYRKDLIEPQLSYRIVGVLFQVYNELGHGYQEKIYQRAIRDLLKEVGIKFNEQVGIPLTFRSKTIGTYYLDFLIDDRVVLEIKKGDKFSPRHITQIYAYLRATNLSLGILANFGKEGVHFRRIINLPDHQPSHS